ncbi:MAG: enoyl-CoA hydratase-related protein [Actinomycetota bacterium]
MDVQDHGTVRVLAFDRPDKLNALDADLADRGAAALAAAADDDAVGAVVLTGTGRAFCAGVDLDHLAAMSRGEESSAHTIAFNDAVRHFPKPIIAAVNGLAVGVGATMCLHVDLVVAGSSARFRTPFAALGVAPEIGSSWLLPQQVGYQRAAWMLMSSEWVDAPTAVAWGLAFEMVVDDELLARAVDRAGVVAAHDPEAVAAIKRTLAEWRLPAIEAAEAAENAEFSRLLDRFR